jgi:tetratricopeptide (TPR) repeat protein
MTKEKSPALQPDELKLLNAQRQRLAKDTKMAALTLVGLLESSAPDAIKRTALLELAAVARDENDLVKAEQIYAQWIERYPKDPSVPRVLFYQGKLYRKIGSDGMALSKFFAVMHSAVNLPLDHLEEYQRLVLLAQTEIADTYYSEGKFVDAGDFFKRLLKLDSAELNRPAIQYKLISSYSLLGAYADVVVQAQDFVRKYPDEGKLPEVRFLLAKALKQLGRNSESLQHVMVLLESKSGSAAQSPSDWAYWQQRTGNEIANQLYQEGDYLKALMIYENLAKLDNSVPWQLPVWYQIGLVNERLNQPQQANDYYRRIIDREKELPTGDAPGLRTVIDMAKWRLNYLGWEVQAEKKSRELNSPGEDPQSASVDPPRSKP